MAEYKWIVITAVVLLFYSIRIVKTVQLTRKYKKLERLIERDEYILDEYLEWIRKISEDNKIESPLVDKGIRRVAIYGMGRLGENLTSYLKSRGFEVDYGIDSTPDRCFSEIPVFGLNDELPPVDAIIVTPAYAIDSITERLSAVSPCPIISIDELIFCNK